MSGSYMPKQLLNFLQTFSFDKNVRKIIPLNSTNYNPGDIVSLDMPPHATIDLSTLKIYSYASTTGQPAAAGKTPAVCLPREAETLISRVQCTSNGQMVSQGPQHWAHLYSLLSKHMLGDKINDRKLLSLASPIPTSDAGYNQTQTANANVVGGLVTNVPVVWSHFLDFLSSTQQIYDTELLPLRVEMTLASPNVLGYDNTNTLAGSQSFTLSGLYATVEVWQLPTEYYVSQQRYLQGGGVIQRLFDKWTSFGGSLIPVGQGSTQVTRFQASFSSLDTVLATFITGNPSGSSGVYLDGVAQDQFNGQNWSLAKHSTGDVDTFSSYGADVGSWSFAVNSQLYPQIGQIDNNMTYSFLSDVLGTSQDAHSIVNSRAILSNDAFQRSAWCCGISLALHTDPADRVQGGLNTRASNCEISWSTTGATSPKASIVTTDNGYTRIPLIFCKSSSVIKIGAACQFEQDV